MPVARPPPLCRSWLLCVLVCTLLSVGSFQRSGLTHRHARRQRHNEGAATTTAAAAAAAAAVSKPQQQVQQGRYTLQDLLVVIPSSHDRLSLVEAGRAWRKGMQAFIVLDRPLDTRSASQSFLDGREEYRESFGHYADVTDGHVWSTPGDARAALAPFRANRTLGIDSYKWILYGDDDTVWFPDVILRMVNGQDHANGLDHDLPYFLTDHIWFPEWKGRKDRYVHASRRAPRCLPCNYTDPLEATGVGNFINSFHAVKACPCNLDAMCKGPPNPHIINEWDCSFSRNKPGWWYFGHGGAGAVLSAGLFRRCSYADVEHKVANQPVFTSGDCAFTDIMWDKFRILPTDPGIGYYRPHIRLFDPGWRGPQAKAGSQDMDTEDWGNDPPGALDRLTTAVAGSCDAGCLEAMDWMATIHLRSRFCAADVVPSAQAELAAKNAILREAPEKLQPAVYLHLALADLGKRYHAGRQAGTIKMSV